MDAILTKAMDQGLWAVLFVVLLFYILEQQKKRDIKSEEREIKYQEIIKELGQGIICRIDNVAEKVEEILRK